jgi:hypothetical protein
MNFPEDMFNINSLSSGTYKGGCLDIGKEGCKGPRTKMTNSSPSPELPTQRLPMLNMGRN